VAGPGERSIVVVVDRFPQVSQTFVVDHIRGLAELGWSVHVAAKAIDYGALQVLDLWGRSITLHELAAPARSDMLSRGAALARAAARHDPRHLRSVNFRSAAYFTGSLRRLLRRVDPSVVHAHFAHNGLLAAMAADGSCPVLVTYHGYDVLQLPLREGWDAFRALLRGTHGVVHSSFLEEHVDRHLDVHLHRVTLGVDGKRFGGANRDDRWPDVLRLLTVGRLVPQKGQGIAIEALANLRSEPRALDANLTVIGDGPNLSRLQDLAKQLAVEDHVRFAGPQPPQAVADAMSKADLLLVPSVERDGWQESFCLVAVEGMASGLAVIGTATGGLAETIGSGGFVVEPDDPVALARRVLSIIEDEGRSAIELRARAQAARFSSEQMREEYGRVTRQVAQSGASRGRRGGRHDRPNRTVGSEGDPVTETARERTPCASRWFKRGPCEQRATLTMNVLRSIMALRNRQQTWYGPSGAARGGLS
jgi:colanic acid/amylovoran biosynthesis glycosyltransferase